MKATLLFTLFLSFGLLQTLNANSTAVDDSQFCLYNQLTSQNWESTPGTIWQFNDDGSLLQLTAAADEVTIGQWYLHPASKKAILQVDLGHGQVYWSWENDCSAASFRLTGALEQEIDVRAVSRRAVRLDWLIGDWQEGLHDNHPVITFDADGTF
jgi:hypothetical protein